MAVGLGFYWNISKVSSKGSLVGWQVRACVSAVLLGIDWRECSDEHNDPEVVECLLVYLLVLKHSRQGQ